MSTAPVIPAPTGFWAELKLLLPDIEMAGNIALLASGVGAGVEPLVAALENATQPLVQSLGTKQPASTEMFTFYSTAIGILTTIKALPGVPAATLTEIDGYLLAAQTGTGKYFAAQQGFNPANYAPVAPIA